MIAKIKYLVLFLLFAGISISSTSTTSNQIEKIIVSNSAFKTLPSDNFTFGYSTIEDEIIMIKVNYDGGCGFGKFTLVAESSYNFSGPIPSINARLSFEDKDYCNSNVSQNLRYDLSNLKIGKYNMLQINLKGYGPIIFNY